MPKKTKKEKIIAQYRKRLKLLQGVWFKIQPIKETLPSQTYKYKEDQTREMTKYPNRLHLKSSTEEDKALSQIQPNLSWIKQENKEINQSKKIHQYFFQDLRKSLFLSFLVIALEICLYFVRIIK